MTNLNELTIQEAQKGLSQRKFSCVELVSACLTRIKQIDPKLNSFITVCEKEALIEAEKADKEYKEVSQYLKEKPLLGIPIAIKDLYLTRGIRTTAASKVLDNYLSVYDASVIAKLKNSGAIILGKTNCDAWAHGASGENSQYGPTKNPWDLSRIPGGSSSGSAAAVIADECIAAMGTDTGGSIRLPASFCNLVGLKPTYGRVSRYGVIAMASSLDSMGHLTKTVYDSAQILAITAGKDIKDSTTADVFVDNYLGELEKDVKGMKVGIPKEYFESGLDPQIQEKVMAAVKAIQKLGVEVLEISLPYTKYALAVYYLVVPSELSSNLARYDGVRYGNDRSFFGDEAKRRIMLGTFALSSGYYDAYYLKAMQVRTLIREDFEKAFKKVDMIITPVSPTLPFKIGEKVNDPLQMYLADIYTVTANLAGIPGLSIPVGFIDHLPVGMQLLGPQFSESNLFRIGFAYERETQWFKQKVNI